MIAFLLMLASFSAGGADSTCSVNLTVDAKVKSVDVSGKSSVSANLFEVRIRNTGPVTLTLVEPGDASGDGWRTPIVKWQVELVGATYVPPKLGRCGNINPLHPEEVFELKPGESHLLARWVPPVWVTQSGTYKLRLRYENDPHLKWSGITIVDHDRDAMERVRNSTACVAVSNEVVLNVSGAPTNQTK